MSETYHPEVEGPPAIRIDRQTYSDLKDTVDSIAYFGFEHCFPVEVDPDPAFHEYDPDTTRIIVQVVRISDEYLDALAKTGFDIKRILTPERLEAYELNKSKN